MDGTNIRRWAAVAALAAVVGCTETRTYTVSVHNATDRPMTVCLTKSHGPAEVGWESPEQVAGPVEPGVVEPIPGAVIKPGKVASMGPINGTFYRDRGGAELRVYAGTPTLNQLNAISPGSLNRVDVPLRQGENSLEVQDGADGRLRVIPAAPPMPGTRPVGG